MTNYHITDPAEIAKLPHGYFLMVDGSVWHRAVMPDSYSPELAPWTCMEHAVTDHEILMRSGGIAARLVPDQDWPPVMQDMIEEVKVQQAQRDRAVELLRRVLGDLEHGPGGNEIDGATADLIGSFLAEQQPCQRCGGEGIVNRGSATWERPCPDCKGGAS